MTSERTYRKVIRDLVAGIEALTYQPKPGEYFSGQYDDADVTQYVAAPLAAAERALKPRKREDRRRQLSFPTAPFPRRRK